MAEKGKHGKLSAGAIKIGVSEMNGSAVSLCLFVFLSRHHSDQMSEGFQTFKVTLCVKILKWQSVSDDDEQG